MTDSEIIKALDCCKYDDCNNCPNVVDNCHANLIDYAISLINRQKEEIKRLKEENNHFANIGKMDSKIKSEAIKEFAERVKDLIYEADDINPVSETQIDNLVKEMVGE